ncbi:hypothetical protein PUMCH_001263 [Australozyma saopauloensis]|uniref:Mitochondrial carrier protein n=1 Tax=Australozyma saopauloensis TaxID=291208 RepID=A0AAX4H6Z5_9ASCO|nr:hypothetical protein PUMCH_001263 [[Candida] saopauloensis]
MNTTPQGDNLLTALAAGCTASGLAALFTFPLDFAKTRQQLTNQAARTEHKVYVNIGSISHVMTGSSALVAGSVVKNFSRIVSYNWASNFMAIDTRSEKKKTSAPRVVIAAAMTGFMESLWIVPFERIKTTMIENRLLEAEKAGNLNPALDITRGKLKTHHKNSVTARQYLLPHAYYTSEVVNMLKSGKTHSKFLTHTHLHGQAHLDALKIEFNKTPALTFFKTVRQMYALEGIHAFTAGTMITLLRQCGTSAAWFSTYNATRQLIDPHGNSAEPRWFSRQIGTTQQSFLYLVSALATVAVTQPIDVVKSHIQLKNGKLLYKDSLTTAYKLVAKKGFWLLYAGAFPRGLKIAAHGSLTALLYSYVEKSLNVMGNEFVFTD